MKKKMRKITQIKKLVFMLAMVFIVTGCSDAGNMQMKAADSKAGIQEIPSYSQSELKEFERLCTERTPDNWMSMKGMKGGRFTSEKSCWGCMSDDGMDHFCSMEGYRQYLKLSNQ